MMKRRAVLIALFVLGLIPGSAYCKNSGRVSRLGAPVSTFNNAAYAPFLMDAMDRIRKSAKRHHANFARETVVQFKIHNLGELSDLKVSTSSGSKPGDEMAMRVVEDAAPFRPLPEKDRKEVSFSYTFSPGTEGFGRLNLTKPEEFLPKSSANAAKKK